MLDWSTACPNWEDRIVAGQSLIAAPVLFEKEAEAALEVFKSLHVVDIPGRPTFGECGDEWIFDLVRVIFGAYDSESGRQLIREFFLCVSKKNAKSTIAAGIMLTALIRNWRYSNELLILAPTIEAAQNSYKPAADMIEADSRLQAGRGGFLHIQDHLRTITHLSNKATLRVIAADGKTVVGKKAAFILVDELWEFGTKSNANGMLREATGGMVSRPEGFLVTITTQSDKPPQGVFKDKLEYGRDVRDGKIQDNKFLPVIYEFPKKMVDAEEYLDPANFYITNPNLNRSVSHEWLADELAKEVRKDAGIRNVFLAKHLNVQIGQHLAEGRWPGADYWTGCANPNLTLSKLLDRCDIVVVGIDGGGLDDLFGMCVLGREEATGRLLAWFKAWAHESVLLRYPKNEQMFRDFAADGDLTITNYRHENVLTDEDGNDTDEIASVVSVDLDEMVGFVDQIRDSGKLAQIGFDPYGIKVVVEALEAAGYDRDDWMVWVSQGYKLQGTIKTYELYLSVGTLEHNGSALMNWCVGNARVKKKGNAVVMQKEDNEGKIDPLMAMFTAGEVLSSDPEPKSSVYEDIARRKSKESDDDKLEEIELTNENEPDILNDPSHPMWKKARERYERRLSRSFGDHGDYY